VIASRSAQVAVSLLAALMVVMTLAGGGAAAPAAAIVSFGENEFGELGTPTNNCIKHNCSHPPVWTPTAVNLPGEQGAVTDAAVGGFFTLLVSGGRLYAFGDNRFGELGSTVRNDPESTLGNNANPRPALVRLPGQVGAVTHVAAGAQFSLAVTASGQLYAFGDNSFGQLGNTINEEASGAKPAANPTPTLVTLPGQRGAVKLVAAGADFSLVVTSTDQLYAFGDNDSGQLGYPEPRQNATPRLVTLPGEQGTITQVAAGLDFSLVVTSSGQLYAFGDNNAGQLGTTVNIGTFSDTSRKPNPRPALVTLPAGDSTVREVAAGRDFSLVVTLSGQLYAFGDNNWGQLGNTKNVGTSRGERAYPVANPTPVQVTLPGINGTVLHVTAGQIHSLAVTSSGQLYGFGNDLFGQLGRLYTPLLGSRGPILVSLPLGMAIDNVAKGAFAYHSIAIPMH
jgi:alpha-tubulin suppressor-like RCC1 family protein